MAACYVQCIRVMVVTLSVTSLMAMCPHEDPNLTLWSNASTWPDNKVPDIREAVTVTGQVLLDVSPPELFSLTIAPGGVLVWSPQGDYHVTTNYIDVKGAFHMGSDSCPFEANARITLTGNRNDYKNMPKFGQKYVGVDRDGTLEIHGKKKLSWTKLTRTVPRLQPENGLIFTSLDRPIWRNKQGLAVYTFNPDGSWLRSYVFQTSESDPERAVLDISRIYNNFKNIPAGTVILMAIQYTLLLPGQDLDLSHVYDAVEKVAGIKPGLGKLRQAGLYDAYALATVKGDRSKTMETLTPVHYRYQTAEATVTINNLFMVAISRTLSYSSYWNSHIEFNVVDKSASVVVLHVHDDVSSWDTGDRLLLTSTDYDMERAEEATVIKCDKCSGKQVMVSFRPKYMHYGRTEYNVDMQGEVALLSRNIVIEGAMNTFCPPANGNCDDFQYDTFGGHLKAVLGFKDVHIEGVELVHMGKQTDLGHYPLHFHMCEDVDEPYYKNPPYLRDNSIHHSFARCITVHGTHGVTVMDNVGYESLGHCYFLEDGGEKRTIFDGNLGASTRPGLLIPSDSQPTTFWITNPITVLRNNVAAGSKDMGFWFIFPVIPLGLSANMTFMQEDEARFTAITEFANNVAHSNKNGLFIDKRLDENGTVVMGNMYTPKEIPLDPTSPDKNVIIDRLTAYQNQRNVWIRGGYITVSRASLAGSRTSITMARSSQQNQFLDKSVILGLTHNTGSPTSVYGSEGRMVFPYSIPTRYNYNEPMHGFAFYDGPVYISDTFFGNFTPNQYRTAGALGFKRHNNYYTSPISSTRNIRFGFPDGVDTGNRMYDGNSSVPGYDDRDGDIAAKFVDTDGSVTTMPGSSVVRPEPFMTTPSCKMRSNWNLMICPHKYIEVRFDTQLAENKGLKPFALRDDEPYARRNLTLEHSRSFSVISNGQYSYSMHWPNRTATVYTIRPRGLVKGFSVRIGVCLPLNAVFDLTSIYPKRAIGLRAWTKVNSIQEIDDDNDGGKYYLDNASGMLYIKLLTLEERVPGDTAECAGRKCPSIRVTITGGDLMDADCSGRDTPASPAQKSVLQKMDIGLPKVDITASKLSFDTFYEKPPKDWGAGKTVPFTSRLVMDGDYGEWTGWGRCTTSCGGGESVRTRACDNPIPRNGGLDCVGPNHETMTCNDQHCPIDGAFGEWSTWSDCMGVVGCYGYQNRKRACDNPGPEHGGRHCRGCTAESQPCKSDGPDCPNPTILIVH